MANDVARNVWLLDTAAVITTNHVFVKGWEWNPTASGDDLQIEDRNGNVLLKIKATGTRESADYGDCGRDFDGFEVAVIDTGTLQVWV